MITWDDSMSTGLPNIDAQHKEIIEKYNELDEALAQGSGRARTVAGELLDFLQFYSAWHFEREEKCMEEYKCPAAEANKQAHAEFTVIFGQLYEECGQLQWTRNWCRKPLRKSANGLKTTSNEWTLNFCRV